jgi:hypothetical protein
MDIRFAHGKMVVKFAYGAPGAASLNASLVASFDCPHPATSLELFF